MILDRNQVYFLCLIFVTTLSLRTRYHSRCVDKLQESTQNCTTERSRHDRFINKFTIELEQKLMKGCIDFMLQAVA